MPDSFLPADLPALAGDVLVDEASLARAALDWGRVVHARPRAVVRPATADDVAAVVSYANRHDLPVAARGAGHSPFGQSQAAGGIVLDMTSLSTVYAGSGDSVVVDAGVRWRDVLAATLPRGLTPPVLTDYLDLTVGGTLAVGGLGGASHHHGAQTDLVTELDVVTGTGEQRRCSPENDGELFDAVRAGLGQCGIVTRAAIRLRPSRQRARRWRLYYDSAESYLADQRAVAREGRFDFLEGQAVLDDESGSWRYLLEAARYFSLPDEPDDDSLLGDLGFDADTLEREDTTYLEFLDRMSEGEGVLRAEGSWYHPHPWVNLLVPDDAVETLVPATLAATRGADLGDSGLVLLYPIPAARLTTPLLRLPPGELAWVFAFLRTGDPYDVAGTARMVEANTALYEQVRDAGGTAYPANMLPMTPKDWAAHFGDAWPGLEAAKREHDPKGLLNPGQGLTAL